MYSGGRGGRGYPGRYNSGGDRIFSRVNDGSGEAEGRMRGLRNVPTSHSSYSPNSSSGGFGARGDSFNAQRNSTSFNDTQEWPKSDAGGFSSGGFGTPIDDNSFFSSSQKSAPHAGQGAATGFGCAAVAGPTAFFSPKQKPTVPGGNENAAARRNFGGPAAPTRGGFASVNDTNTQMNENAESGAGTVFDAVKRDSDPSSRKQPWIYSPRGGRRGGITTASSRPLPVAAPKVSGEAAEQERLTQKLVELMNDDGGRYTSDEEEKPPIRQKNDQATPTANVKSEETVSVIKPAVPIRPKPIYEGEPRGGHGHPDFLQKPKPSPLVAVEAAQPQKRQDDGRDEQEKVADSILKELLSHQELRQKLKNHCPMIFDDMVKHLAYVAARTNT